ncbi:MAG: hypothetical protein ACHQFW_10570 [Chitinophagales bacterium]
MKTTSLIIFMVLAAELSAQISPPKFSLQTNVGIAYPLRFNISDEGLLHCDMTTDLSLIYHFGEKYFVGVNYSRSEHDLQWELHQQPLAPTEFNYFAAQVGAIQRKEKFFISEDIGIGMLNFKFFEFQQTNPYLINYSAFKSNHAAIDMDFAIGYSINNFIDVNLKTGLMFSKINWDLHYYGTSVDEEGSYKVDDYYAKTLHYMPVEISMGIVLHI